MSLLRSLSGRLLLLTAVFVMLVEVLIFVPSLARFREAYLTERLLSANVVAVALSSRRAIQSPGLLERELLASAEVLSIALRRDGVRFPVLMGQMSEPVEWTFDLDEAGTWDLIRDAFGCMLYARAGRVIRVIGTPEEARNPLGHTVEITLEEDQLHQSMMGYGVRIFALSLVISLLTAGLVYLTMNRWLVGPIRRLIEAMGAFRAAPEAAPLASFSVNGHTELDEAARELASMQSDVRAALRQKTRLAALGEAVAKINHDLRNMLTSAQLLADRLERSEDPLVARTAPKLLRSLDRATALCTQTLAYGSAEEPEPSRRRVMLRRLAEEVREGVIPEEIEGVSIEIDIGPDVFAEADADQLYRALSNLVRNAEQAITGSQKGSEITISAHREEGAAIIEVGDNGPGIPAVARDYLFKPFRGSGRKGGTGLGLSIARELVETHGGSIELAYSTTEGTLFKVRVPDTANGGVGTAQAPAPFQLEKRVS